MIKLFSEKVNPTYTNSDRNILYVKDFKEVFFDIFEFEINGNNYIAEKVSTYNNYPVVNIPITENNISYNVPFVLKRGKFKIMYNDQTLDSSKSQGIVVEKQKPVDNIPPVATITENNSVVNANVSVDIISDILQQKKDELVQEIGYERDKIVTESYLEKEKELAALVDKVELSNKTTRDGLEQVREKLVEEFNIATVETKSALTDLNIQAEEHLIKYIKGIVSEKAESLQDSILDSKKQIDTHVDKEINSLAKELTHVVENNHGQLSTTIASSLDKELEKLVKKVDIAIDKKNVILNETIKAELQSYESELLSVQQSTVELNDVINKTSSKALSRIGNVKKDLSADVTSIQKDVTSIQKDVDSLETQLNDKLVQAENNIKEYYDGKLKIVESTIFKTVEDSNALRNLINESKNTILTDVKQIKGTVPKMASADNGAVNIKRDLEKTITKRFNDEIVSIKRLIEMSSGGGSVAMQFADGGTMNGNLTIVGTISAREYLGIPSGGGGGGGAFTAGASTVITPTSAVTLGLASGDEAALTLDYTTNKLAGNDTGLLINQTDTLSNGTSKLLDLQVGGVSKFSVDSSGKAQVYAVDGATYVRSSQFILGHPTSLVRLYPDGAGNLAQYNGAASQGYNIYNTRTSATEYERAHIGWNDTADTFVIGTEAGSGGGTVRGIDIKTGTISRLAIGTGATVSRNSIVPSFNGVMTLGGSTQRWRNLYLGEAALVNDEPVINVASTWNNAAVPFTLIKADVTDTASAVGSKLLDLQVGGTSKFSVGPTGTITIDPGTNNALIQTSSIFDPVIRVRSGGYGHLLFGVGSSPWHYNTIGFDIGFKTHAGGGFQWSSVGSDSTAASDLILARDAANTLGQRNGVNAQTSNIYNTYTDASNYERLAIQWAGNDCLIQTQRAGNGASRQMHFAAAQFRFTAPAGVNLQTNTNLSVADGEVYLTQLNLTEDLPALNITSTWNAATTALTLIKANVTNTASAAGSKLLDLQVGGVSKFSVDDTGGLSFPGSSTYQQVIKFSNTYPGYLRADGAVSVKSITNENGGNFLLGSAGIKLGNSAVLSFTQNNAISNAADLELHRDAADTLAQRRGTNAQTFNIYNTYTNATQYERAHIGWNDTADTFVIGTEAGSGGGTVRPVEVAAPSLTLKQGADASQYTQSGFRIYGFDNVSNYFLHIGVKSNGRPDLYSNLDWIHISSLLPRGATRTGWLGSEANIWGKIWGAEVNIDQGTLTDDAQALNITSTWNDAADTFTLIKADVTNTASAAGSKLLDLQVGGVSKFSVSNTGVATSSLGADYASLFPSLLRFYDNSVGVLAQINSGNPYVSNGAAFQLGSLGALSWQSVARVDSGSADLKLTRAAAATLQLGEDHATTPTGQTIKAHDVTAGTGADLTLSGGLGSVANGDVVIEAGASTLTVQAAVNSTALLDSAGALVISKAGSAQFTFGGGSGNYTYRPFYSVAPYNLGLSTHRWATTYTQALDVAQGTLTDDAQALNITSTWNDAADTFTLIKADVTNTASAAGSKLMDLQVGGVSKFSVDATGAASAKSIAIDTSSTTLMAGSGIGGWYGSLGFFFNGNLNGTWTSSVLNIGGSMALQLGGLAGLQLSKPAAATLQLGTDHATTPTGQTIKAHDVTAGAGADLTLSGGLGSVANGHVILDGDVHATAGVIGADNNFIGRLAGSGNSGGRNTGVGTTALASNTGSNNTANGYQTLFLGAGNYNTASGIWALYGNTGSNNTASGNQSLYSNTGSSNTASGNESGAYQSGGTTALTTASNSVFLGATTKGIQGATNQIVIGDTAESIGANSVVLGNDSIVTTALKGNVGIGTTTPSELLHIRGGISPTIKLEGYSTGATQLFPAISFHTNNNQGSFESARITSYGYNPGGYNQLDFSINQATGSLQKMWSMLPTGDLYQSHASNNNLSGSGLRFQGSATGGTDYRVIQIEPTGSTGHPGMMLKIKAGDANAAAANTLNFGGNIFINGGSPNINGASPVYGDVILAHDGTTAGGNVGIGTTTPTAALQVVGDVHAGLSNTGTGCNFIGSGAGESNSGNDSSGFGYDSLKGNSGHYNTASGMQSLYQNTGSYNTASGVHALRSNTGANNTASGVFSLYSNTGSSNTASGYNSGRYQSGGTTALTTASNSVFLGATTKGIQGATNQIVIGDTAESIGANSVVLGNDSIVTTALKGNVGIGTTTPVGLFSVKPHASYPGQMSIGMSGNGSVGPYLIFGHYNNTSLTSSFKLGNNNSGQLSLLSPNNTELFTASNSGVNFLRIRVDSYGALYQPSIQLTSNASGVIGLYVPGGTGAQNLGFITSSLERARFDGAGNFGIGTTTPGHVLDVVGSVNVDSASSYKKDGTTILDYDATLFNVAVGEGALASASLTGTYNVAIGYQSLYLNTTGSSNIASGYRSLYLNTTGSNNIASGYHSLYANTTGSSNIASGYQSLKSNTTGNQNTATGTNSLYANTTGINNVASGSHSLYSNTTGGHNTASGFRSLYSNTIGGHNTASGAYSLYANTTGNYNVASGAYSLRYNTTGSSNVASGYYSLYQNTTGGSNTASGYQSLISNTTGGSNTATGSQNLFYNTTGSINTATGRSNLYQNTTGGYNIATGYQNLFSNTTGGYNTASGMRSLFSNTTGNYNIATGTTSLYSNTTGNYNIASGYQSLYYNTTGTYNTASGIESLYSNTTGSYNIANGYQAGRFQADGTTALTVADDSIFIGKDTRGVDSATNQIVIGDTAIGLGSNTVVLGADTITTTALKGDVGIGTTTPSEKLDVVGNITASGTVKTTPTTVALLPAAATAGAGARTFVTDSANTLASHHGQTVAGGGSDFVPVFSDGTNWIIG